MSVKVLLSKSSNRRARAALRARGLDFLTSFPGRVLRKLGVLGGVSIGGMQKSWDVLSALELLEGRLPKTARILDVGTCCSEVVYTLNSAGFTSVVGIDLSPLLYRAQRPDGVSFVAGDLLSLPFASASFEAITAISVLEHGFDGRLFLGEASRVLRPSGYVVATVDYWPDKIDTRGVRAYGMDWIIFSRRELKSLVANARDYSLSLIGCATYEAHEKTLKWMGRSYTSAMVVLRKGGPFLEKCAVSGSLDAEADRG